VRLKRSSRFLTGMRCGRQPRILETIKIESSRLHYAQLADTMLATGLG
jgi:hypothetical protein